MVVIRVRGLPVAQGSVRAFVAGGRAHVATDARRTNSPLGAWRTAIATEARAAFGDTPAPSGPIDLDVVLEWPRPLAHYRGGKPERGLRPDAPVAKASKPDVDKVVRAVLDALDGIAYRDDAQVANLHVAKVWGEEPGATIGVAATSEDVA